jgi:hypothetical protein
LFFAGAVASTVCSTAAGSFVVSGFMSSDRGYLGDPVVDPHEVSVLNELGDDFTGADPLSPTCYRSDRHEALFGSGVHPVGDLIQSLGEVPEGESLRTMCGSRTGGWSLPCVISD